jgi:hypothetical protein
MEENVLTMALFYSLLLFEHYVIHSFVAFNIISSEMVPECQLFIKKIIFKIATDVGSNTFLNLLLI